MKIEIYRLALGLSLFGAIGALHNVATAQISPPPGTYISTKTRDEIVIQLRASDGKYLVWHRPSPGQRWVKLTLGPGVNGDINANRATQADLAANCLGRFRTHKLETTPAAVDSLTLMEITTATTPNYRLVMRTSGQRRVYRFFAPDTQLATVNIPAFLRANTALTLVASTRTSVIALSYANDAAPQPTVYYATATDPTFRLVPGATLDIQNRRLCVPVGGVTNCFLLEIADGRIVYAHANGGGITSYSMVYPEDLHENAPTETINRITTWHQEQNPPLPQREVPHPVNNEPDYDYLDEDDDNYHDDAAGKPVICLYPPVPTECTVRLRIIVPTSSTYPVCPEGQDPIWQVTAHPDGHLVDTSGHIYPSLFWETQHHPIAGYTFPTGEIVEAADVAQILEARLNALGLNAQERTECIQYWLPQMVRHPYVFMHFVTEGYGPGAVSYNNGPNAQLYAADAELDITPRPDALLRLFIVWQGLNEQPTQLPLPQTFAPALQRTGFTVVEWGGSERGHPILGASE